MRPPYKLEGQCRTAQMPLADDLPTLHRRIATDNAFPDQQREHIEMYDLLGVILAVVDENMLIVIRMSQH
jgi:hypothetical protein